MSWFVIRSLVDPHHTIVIFSLASCNEQLLHSKHFPTWAHSALPRRKWKVQEQPLGPQERWTSNSNLISRCLIVRWSPWRMGHHEWGEGSCQPSPPAPVPKFMSWCLLEHWDSVAYWTCKAARPWELTLFFTLEELWLNCSLVASKVFLFLSRGKPQCPALPCFLPQGSLRNLALRNSSLPPTHGTIGRKPWEGTGICGFFFSFHTPPLAVISTSVFSCGIYMFSQHSSLFPNVSQI